MGRHLAMMATTPVLRGEAVAWFGRLSPTTQLDMIRATVEPDHARELLYLVPDARQLLPHLEMYLVRAVSDEHPEMIAAIEPERLPGIIRITRTSAAKRGWLAMIAVALEHDHDRFEAFLDALPPEELATWLIGLFCPSDLVVLRDASGDPQELDERYGELLHFAQLQAACHPEHYRATLAALVFELNTRDEYRSRQRSLAEIQAHPWSARAAGEVFPDDGEHE